MAGVSIPSDLTQTLFLVASRSEKKKRVEGWNHQVSCIDSFYPSLAGASERSRFPSAMAREGGAIQLSLGFISDHLGPPVERLEEG